MPKWRRQPNRDEWGLINQALKKQGLVITLEQAEAQSAHFFNEARKYLLRRQPFYGSFLCNLETLWDLDVPTAATDGTRLLLNPLATYKISMKEWRFLLVHEIQHVAHLHSFRQRDKDHFLWNIACDYAINLLLDNEHEIKVLPNSLLDYQFNGMSPEEIYKIIIKDAVFQKMAADAKAKEGKGQSMPGPGAAGSQGQGDEDDANEHPRGYGTEEGDQTRTISVDTFHGDVLNPDENLTKLERERLEVRARQMAYQAAFTAKNMGKDTSTSAQIIASMESQPDWVLSLNSFVENAIDKDDYTWSRPRRRYVMHDIYLPDMGGTKPPKQLAVVLDVSGSINEKMLEEFLEQLGGCIQANTNISFKVFTVDTRIHSITTVSAEDLPLKFDISNAGGGTNFRPAFDHLENEDDPLPSGLIYFTDLECDNYPDVEPPYPVMWLNFGRVWSEDKARQHQEQYGWRWTPPWGEVINMQKHNW